MEPIDSLLDGANSPILLVDDIRENLRLLEVILKSAGFSNVLSCQGGQDGLDALSTFKPHLIILDLQMPKIDGYAFLGSAKQLISDHSFTPILVLTADTSSQAKIRALKLGASDFLTKPCDIIEIQLKVSNFLRIRSMQEELQRNSSALEVRVRERTEDLAVLNEELIRARDEALFASRVKSQFLANMNHELRTPMNGVIGFTSLLLARGFDESTDQILKAIESSANTQLRVLDDILELSEFEVSSVRLSLAASALDEIAQAAVTRFQKDAESRNLEIEYVPSEKPAPSVFADSFRLGQLFDKLIANAVKFTDKGKITVSWSWTVENDRLLATFAVKDTGIGIASDLLEHIFISFTQAEGFANRRYAGAGLGLTLTKRFVELMGGNISVTSEVGIGTAFTLRIPFDLVRNEVKELHASPAVRQEAGANNTRVLVAEDNEVNLMVAHALLKECGCAVSDAINGLEAIEMTATQSFDLVLMDLQMPLCDGLEAVRSIRRRESLLGIEPVPIYALTANATARDREDCLKVGMIDLIAKPIKLDVMKALIQKVAERRQLHRN